MAMNTWVSVILEATPKMRNKIKKSTLDGISFFKANWGKKSRSNTEQHTLKSKNPSVGRLLKDLKAEKSLKFVGFIPEVTYVKEKGTKEQLSALWEHKFGTPALLYAHDDLPILIIAGPNIMFNDSIVRQIKTNDHLKEVAGITG